jgi:predicted metal-dependent hydrolase
LTLSNKPFIIQPQKLYPHMSESLTIDEIILTRRKTIALIVQPNGRLIVRAPLRTSQKEIRLLVDRNAGWIRNKQELVKSTYVALAPRRFVTGENFYFLGNQYPLEIVNVNHPALKFDNKFYLSKTALPHARIVFERWYRQQALDTLTKRVQDFTSQHGFQYTQVKISSARTRWGSCSARGNLSFTWRLVMAPLPVIDYVVVHELVHIKVRNHSRHFWDQVSQLMPDYKARRSWLKENGHFLNL